MSSDGKWLATGARNGVVFLIGLERAAVTARTTGTGIEEVCAPHLTKAQRKKITPQEPIEAALVSPECHGLEGGHRVGGMHKGDVPG